MTCVNARMACFVAVVLLGSACSSGPATNALASVPPTRAEVSLLSPTITASPSTARVTSPAATPAAPAAATATPLLSVAQDLDPVAILKATKFVYLDASAFQASRGGPIFVTSHEPLAVTWTDFGPNGRPRFAAKTTWTYTSAGSQVEHQMEISGSMFGDAKSLVQFVVTEVFTIVGSGSDPRRVLLEFANFPFTAVKDDPAAGGRTWLAVSRLPQAKPYLTQATLRVAGATPGVTAFEALTWVMGGVSIGFSEKSQKF